MQVIAGVLGRAGEQGKLRRLAMAVDKKINFAPAANLSTPGHLKSTKKRYPSILKLGGSIEELEEQDRGITYDYRLDGEQAAAPKEETGPAIGESDEIDGGAFNELDDARAR